jgi:hypothetical protein
MHCLIDYNDLEYLEGSKDFGGAEIIVIRLQELE